MDWIKLAFHMRRAALEAGERIMHIYESADFDVQNKADDSPVTAADKAADAIISQHMRNAFPDVPLITEEDAQSHAQSHARFLIVDPLDGTKEFIQRRGDFTVNIAYVENGVPLRGIVYAPARQRMFYTSPDGAAVEEIWPFSLENIGTLQVLRAAMSNQMGLRVVASKSHPNPETDAYIARYNIAERVNAGSSLKLCLIASGEADLYPRLGPTMEWDTAAGDAVLRAAGGRVVQFETHSPLIYGKNGWRNPHFIAAAQGVVLL